MLPPSHIAAAVVLTTTAAAVVLITTAAAVATVCAAIFATAIIVAVIAAVIVAIIVEGEGAVVRNLDVAAEARQLLEELMPATGARITLLTTLGNA